MQDFNLKDEDSNSPSIDGDNLPLKMAPYHLNSKINSKRLGIKRVLGMISSGSRRLAEIMTQRQTINITKNGTGTQESSVHISQINNLAQMHLSFGCIAYLEESV